MFSFLKKYKEAMQLKHGWEVELKCSECGKEAKPLYNGWSPNYEMNFGDRATIYADLKCSNCNKELKKKASEKLKNLFSAIPIESQNKKILITFILFIVVIPFLLIVIFGKKGFFAFPFMMIFIGPAILFFNYKVALLRSKCKCGKPDYVFMGLLGRSYCLRCSSCGHLLRLRD